METFNPSKLASAFYRAWNKLSFKPTNPEELVLGSEEPSLTVRIYPEDPEFMEALNALNFWTASSEELYNRRDWVTPFDSNHRRIIDPTQVRHRSVGKARNETPHLLEEFDGRDDIETLLDEVIACVAARQDVSSQSQFRELPQTYWRLVDRRCELMDVHVNERYRLRPLKQPHPTPKPAEADFAFSRLPAAIQTESVLGTHRLLFPVEMLKLAQKHDGEEPGKRQKLNFQEQLFIRFYRFVWEQIAKVEVLGVDELAIREKALRNAWRGLKSFVESLELSCDIKACFSEEFLGKKDAESLVHVVEILKDKILIDGEACMNLPTRRLLLTLAALGSQGPLHRFERDRFVEIYDGIANDDARSVFSNAISKPRQSQLNRATFETGDRVAKAIGNIQFKKIELSNEEIQKELTDSRPYRKRAKAGGPDPAVSTTPPQERPTLKARENDRTAFGPGTGRSPNL